MKAQWEWIELTAQLRKLSLNENLQTLANMCARIFWSPPILFARMEQKNDSRLTAFISPESLSDTDVCTSSPRVSNVLPYLAHVHTVCYVFFPIGLVFIRARSVLSSYPLGAHTFSTAFGALCHFWWARGICLLCRSANHVLFVTLDYG